MADNGWDEWRQKVLSDLEHFNDRFDKIDKSILGLQLSVVKLQMKAGIWGALAGIMPAVAALIWVMLRD